MKCLLCRFLQQQVDLIGFYRFLHGNAEVNCRYVDGWHAHGYRFKTVVKLRENARNTGRQFGVNRDNRLACCTCASQVRMIGINNLLIVHSGVNRRYGTRFDAIRII
jgi:hypothetical protein